MNFQIVLKFWFEELTPKDWFTKDSELDHRISQQFKSTLQAAKSCELYSWRSSPQGRLAEVIVLDQFSRNIFRDSAAAYTADPLALALAQATVLLGLDLELNEIQRKFLYMPFMHSESPLIHETAVELFTALGNEETLKFELKHKEIIDRFHRYPHRNQALGRDSTPQELEFLKQPGSSF